MCLSTSFFSANLVAEVCVGLEVNEPLPWGIFVGTEEFAFSKHSSEGKIEIEFGWWCFCRRKWPKEAKLIMIILLGSFFFFSPWREETQRFQLKWFTILFFQTFSMAREQIVGHHSSFFPYSLSLHPAY